MDIIKQFFDLITNKLFYNFNREQYPSNKEDLQHKLLNTG